MGMFRVLPTDVSMLVIPERPKDELLLVTNNHCDIAPGVRRLRDLLSFVPEQRPKLPAIKPIAIAPVKERIKIVVGGDVTAAEAEKPIAGLQKRIIRTAAGRRSSDSLDINWPEGEIHLAAEKPVIHLAIDWKKGRVILARVLGSLLEIERKDGKPSRLGFVLEASACKTEQLEELPPVFPPKAVISQKRIQKVELLCLSRVIRCVGEDRWHSGRVLGNPLLPVKQRAQRFRSFAQL